MKHCHQRWGGDATKKWGDPNSWKEECVWVVEDKKYLAMKTTNFLTLFCVEKCVADN